MIRNTKTNVKLTASNAPSVIARQAARWIAAIILCVGLSDGLAPAPVKASAVMTSVAETQYLTGHSYVKYTTNHIASPDGVIQEVTGTTTDGDGHVWDLYGNRLVFNADKSISNSSSQVVGFVY